VLNVGTTSLHLEFCCSSLAVSQIRSVIALLHPRN
jgi:hypothetical protein